MAADLVTICRPDAGDVTADAREDAGQPGTGVCRHDVIAGPVCQVCQHGGRVLHADVLSGGLAGAEARLGGDDGGGGRWAMIGGR